MQRVQSPAREGHAEALSVPRSAPAERPPTRSAERFDAQVARASRSRDAGGRAEQRELRARREEAAPSDAKRSAESAQASGAPAREPADSPAETTAAQAANPTTRRATKAAAHAPAANAATETSADGIGVPAPISSATPTPTVLGAEAIALDPTTSASLTDVAASESTGSAPAQTAPFAPPATQSTVPAAPAVEGSVEAVPVEPKADVSKGQTAPLASLADAPPGSAGAVSVVEPAVLPAGTSQVPHERAQVAEPLDASFAQRLDEQAARAARSERSADVAADILRQVRMNLSGDLREATLQLTPEHLGRVSIRLRIEDGTMRAELRAQTPEALAALERHAPELRAALGAQAGAERAVDLRFGAMPFGAQNGAASGRGRAFGSRAMRSSSALETPSLAPLEGILARRLSTGGIDTYA